MRERWEQITSIGWVAHALHAWQRFVERLGFQLSAAITYFSVMSVIPILAVVFAVFGMVVTVLIPEWLDAVREWITASISADSDLSKQLIGVIDGAFSSWRAIGLVALASAAWTGATWVRHLRADVRVMTNGSVADIGKNPPMPIAVVKNLGVLFGLVLMIGLSVVLSTIATTARSVIATVLGRTDADDPLLRIWPLVGGMVTGWLLFVFLLWVLPRVRIPWAVLWKAALMGALGFGVLQYLIGVLFGIFSGNAAVAVFGSAIAVMLALNLFATLILLVASWAGTHPRYLALQEQPSPVISDVVPAREPSDYATKMVLAELAAARIRAEERRVPHEAAVRSAQLTLGLGVVLGGLATAIAARVGRRR
ncbi:MAG: YihY/virulence factor BrkB family protein [Nigerium sp.]|nr:YihY/virulence factor BrkB family protein [Nigerium sp.]